MTAQDRKQHRARPHAHGFITPSWCCLGSARQHPQGNKRKSTSASTRFPCHHRHSHPPHAQDFSAPCRNFVFASFCCKPRARGFPCQRGPAALLPTCPRGCCSPHTAHGNLLLKYPPAAPKLSPCWEGISPEQSGGWGQLVYARQKPCGFFKARPRTNPHENVREPRSDQVGQAAVPAAALPPAARAARRRRAAWPR